MKFLNPNEPVKEIVAILHKYKIPVAEINQILELVQQDIAENTIPYNPNAEI